MNVLFLALAKIESLNEPGIYSDLLREFSKHGHSIYLVTSTERRNNECTHLIDEKGNKLLIVKTLNIQKTNILEKGIGTLLIESQYKRAIKKYFSGVKFDLILYPTPPITLYGIVKYIKNRDQARTYLMLKDIFPQNAVDMGMLSTSGMKGVLYRYFRNKEKKLYKISDRIGCMSQANVDYVRSHNSEINPSKIEVCPNSIEVVDMSVDDATREEIRNKYNIPLDKKVFIYGGNLGKPQGIDFMIECLKGQEQNETAFFLIVGDGTEFGKIESYVNNDKPINVKLMKRLPKEDYDKMVGACDVGMIFLDHRFTIPNFPSRLLSYMQAKIPVLAITDTNTDIGKIIVDGGFGWWCESNDVDLFAKTIEQATNKHCQSDSFDYLKEHYSVDKVYETIVR